MPAFSLWRGAVRSVGERIAGGAALPARGELRAERFAALAAAPRRGVGGRAIGGRVEQPPRERIVAFVVEPQLGAHASAGKPPSAPVA